MWMVSTLSICGCFTLVMSLAFCLCWKKKHSHSEITFVDGLVLSKNPDENVNHLTSSDNIDGSQSVQNGLDRKRATLTTNTKRSLPDIPSDQEIVEWKPSGDNNSEYYASVEQYQESSIDKNGALSNGNQPRCSVSQHSSLSQADFSPYERVKYDKIKAQEHPYAQLQPPSSRTSTLDNKNDDNCNPGTSQSGNTEGSSTINIPAATAVAGGISANAELPYITSPVPQPNFSGDSQDSSKGYTSISVREPLANIVAETKETEKRKKVDPHYSTVSDDSDDVYTTIPDPNQIYTSESETYAKIPPAPILVEVEINHNASLCSNLNNDEEMYESPPEQVPQRLPQAHTHTHSRQASSSSSIVNVGSPKPEKRQANSPLPPPPIVETQDATPFLSDEKKISRNLDELYAKVQKNKSRSSSSEEEKSPKKNMNLINSDLSSTEKTRQKKLYEHNYETLRKHKAENYNADANYQKNHDKEPGYTSISGNSTSSSDPGYEVLEKKPQPDPNYEELNHPIETNENEDLLLGYSLIKKKKKPDNCVDHNYESVPNSSSDYQYSRLQSNGSETETDPNYESVDPKDPSYESVIRKTFEAGYESVDVSTNGNSTRSEEDKVENPYEKLSSDDTDSIGYSKIRKKSKGDFTESSVESENSNILDDNVIFEV